MSIPEAVSVQQAAAILSVSPNTIRRWIRRKFLLAYRVGPLLVRIPRSEIARMRQHRLDYGVEPGEPHKEYPQV